MGDQTPTTPITPPAGPVTSPLAVFWRNLFPWSELNAKNLPDHWLELGTEILPVLSVLVGQGPDGPHMIQTDSVGRLIATLLTNQSLVSFRLSSPANTGIAQWLINPPDIHFHIRLFQIFSDFFAGNLGTTNTASTVIGHGATLPVIGPTPGSLPPATASLIESSQNSAVVPAPPYNYQGLDLPPGEGIWLWFCNNSAAANVWTGRISYLVI